MPMNHLPIRFSVAPLCALALVACTLLAPAYASDAGRYLHHEITAEISPAEGRIAVTDLITLPPDAPREFGFTLHKGMHPSSPQKGVQITARGEITDAGQLEWFTVVLPPDLRAFTLSYAGVISGPTGSAGPEGAPQGSPGAPDAITQDNVFLSGASAWYPLFDVPLMTFSLETKLPAEWDAVSQGERTIHTMRKEYSLVRWDSPDPQPEIYLVAYRFVEYAKRADGITAMAFLRRPDRELAERYLAATAEYIALYDRLIGRYPYAKFALVEDNLETGLGMPSFTLLGPHVIRLPFIITTSYPHEILHNWWGNGVFADYETGNWSEGLTAYLADYLLREREGGGADYRVVALQKYADYVRGNKDFPLTEFRSRHSLATEAVGYGKGLMVFHMLRRELGDAVFRTGLRKFYRQFKFHVASWEDIERTFTEVSGRNLNGFFSQWVDRTGAPELRVGRASVVPEGDGFRLTAVLKQVQPGPPYTLRVPVAVTLWGRTQAYQTEVSMNDDQAVLNLLLPAPPERLDIDPAFDLFRRLDYDELPPAVSLALGAHRMLIILPAAAAPARLAAYRSFAQSLAPAGPDDVRIALDSKLARLPADSAVLVLGWENRFAPDVLESLFRYDVAVKDGEVRINGIDTPQANHAFALIGRFPQNGALALGLIAADRIDALSGLARKLPHYQRYSYLAFAGAEPVNTLKGRWPVLESPLTVFFPANGGARHKVPMAELAPERSFLDE